MQNNFLSNVATFIFQNHKENLSDLYIVFPNNRAKLFFQKYLSTLSDKPIWSPTILSISALFQKYSEYQISNNLVLIFELYKIFQQEKIAQEKFDEFYYWGEMLLKDFDDIDKNLVDAKNLFQDLSSIKDIENRFYYLSEEQILAIKQFWSSFKPPKISDHQADFIEIWHVLYDVYSKFKKHLQTKSLAYEGMLYKNTAEKIIDGNQLEIEFDKVIFVGFNAINPCEEILFNHLKKRQIAEFYWDFDSYYVNDKKQEAGIFIRKNLKQFPPPKEFVEKHDDKNSQALFNSFGHEKHIEFISSPSDFTQAKIAHKILDKNFTESDFFDTKTALVLADENLLQPVLNSIPEHISSINVTMGFPVKSTPAFSLIQHLFELQKNATSDTNGKISYYFKDILALLKHQYINQFSAEFSEKIIELINLKNRSFIPESRLHANELLKKIFVKADSFDDFSEYLLNILHSIFSHFSTNDTSKFQIEKEYLYQIYLSIKQLNDILLGQQFEIDTKTYISLLKQIIKNLRVPFFGEPLTGLQIMGILETRVLDFENVIILSMNEGKLPAIKSSSSFIPFNLRKGFGMSTIQHNDAIYAYYFYNLIQRAKNIYLVYHTQSSGTEKNEKSRFLHQLKFESDFQITEKNISYNINIQKKEEISVPWSAQIGEEINKFISPNGQKYLSPSAINLFLDCKLKFYFQHIAKMKVSETLLEEIDAIMFGNILHKTIDILYEPFKNKKVSDNNLDAILKNKDLVDKAIKMAFQKEYFKTGKNEEIAEPEIQGRNIIIFEVIKKYVRQIVKIDKHKTPFEIVGLEDKFKIQFPIKSADVDLKINLGGTIDRIDDFANIRRIIDYKTGQVKLSFKSIESLFISDDNKRNNAAFQTFLYCLMYKNQTNYGGVLVPGLYFTKELFNKNFDYNIKMNKNQILNYKDYANEFENRLQNLLLEIFDRNLIFEQTKNSDLCKYCDYSNICGK